MVWVHGAGQGKPIDPLLSRARRLQNELGVNIALPVQPGCGVRRDAWPPYPTMDPLAKVAGVIRALSEVRAPLRWLRPQATTIAIAGLSMGSPVAALVSHLEPVDAVAVFTPILDLNATIGALTPRWDGALRGTRELLQSNSASDLAAAIDYLRVPPSAPPDRRLIVGARHDRMAMREPALALHERWGGRLYLHDGSHVGHVFSSGVRKTTEHFLRAVADPLTRNSTRWVPGRRYVPGLLAHDAAVHLVAGQSPVPHAISLLELVILRLCDVDTTAHKGSQL